MAQIRYHISWRGTWTGPVVCDRVSLRGRRREKDEKHTRGRKHRAKCVLGHGWAPQGPHASTSHCRKPPSRLCTPASTHHPATERSNSALLMHGSSVLAFLCRYVRGPKIQTKRSVCVSRRTSPPLPGVWRVWEVGTNLSPGCAMTSDGEACVLSASGQLGPGKVWAVSFCSEKPVVDGAIVSFVTVRVSFSGGQTRYYPPVQDQVTNSQFPFLSAAVQRHSQSSRILEF